MKTCCVLSLTWAILAASLWAAEKPHDNPPPGMKLTDWQRSHLPPPLETRREQVKPVAEGVFRTRPTFNACGTAFGLSSEPKSAALEYRRVGDSAWTAAPSPVWFYETKDLRGSILRLEEDTAYEARVSVDGQVRATSAFRTWKSEVPVAKTIELDPASVTYPIRIQEKGTPEGWIRYTVKKGLNLGGKSHMKGVIDVSGAEYVLLDDMVIEGGGGYGNVPVLVKNAKGVRIRNCEFFGWGRVGPANFEQFEGGFGGGKFTDLSAGKPGKPPRLINYDCAIHVTRGASEIVIERCYAHDPRGRANSWFYSHPAGPEAVLMDCPDHSCVIRHCDFVGSDNHRWNDAVEGAGNFIADGGFNQDADVYGNFMIYCNDDNIELDGGQQNVRCFDNRFEAALCGVSIQGCCASPVYVFENLFSGMGEEFGYVGGSIKTSTFNPWWYHPYAYVQRNYFQEARDFSPNPGHEPRLDVKDNQFGEHPAQDLLAKYPVRPLDFVLDKGRIDGVAATVEGAVPAVVTVVARSTGSAAVPFAVRQNFDADWFKVEPAKGTIPAGGAVTLTVRFIVDKMADRRDWRAAFLVRTPCGLSRCVSVVATRTDFELPVKPVPPGGKTLYADVSSDTGAFECTFDVKTAGRYWFFMRAQTENGGAYTPKSRVSIDGAEPERMCSPLWGHPTWTMIRPGKKDKLTGVTKHFDLLPGQHTLRVTPNKGVRFVVSGAALTDAPEAFEPR